MEYSYIFAFIPLWIAIILVFFYQHKVSIILSILSLTLAVYLGVIKIVALILLLFLLLSSHLVVYYNGGAYRYERFLFWIFMLVTTFLSLGMGFHAFPGFNNPLIVDEVLVSQGSVAFTLYWNYDKAYTAFVLILLYSSLSKNEHHTFSKLKESTIVAVATLLIVLTCANLIGIVEWDPKLPNFIVFWVLSNLLITCAAEEAFFRGLLQYNTQRLLSKISRTRCSALIPIIFVGTLFGIAHYAMGIEYVLIAILAGIGYGLVFHLSGRLEASIVTHFLLNSLHITFFSYPMITTTG